MSKENTPVAVQRDTAEKEKDILQARARALIYAAMANERIGYDEYAALLGVKSNVLTRTLSMRNNMTLSQLAFMLAALGYEAEVFARQRAVPENAQ